MEKLESSSNICSGSIPIRSVPFAVVMTSWHPSMTYPSLRYSASYRHSSKPPSCSSSCKRSSASLRIELARLTLTALASFQSLPQPFQFCTWISLSFKSFASWPDLTSDIFFSRLNTRPSFHASLPQVLSRRRRDISVLSLQVMDFDDVTLALVDQVVSGVLSGSISWYKLSSGVSTPERGQQSWKSSQEWCHIESLSASLVQVGDAKVSFVSFSCDLLIDDIFLQTLSLVSPSDLCVIPFATPPIRIADNWILIILTRRIDAFTAFIEA